MKIAVLAVQGAFMEHERMLHDIGIESVEIRQKRDLDRDFSGLILPGGESTVQGKLLQELGLLQELKDRIINGMPVLGTCAGMILMAEKIENDEHTYLGTMPMNVRRNAYGRQLGSFRTESEFLKIGKIPMEFIRAPWIESVSEKVNVLATVDEHIVAASYQNQMALSFHPELLQNNKVYRARVKFL